MGGGFVRRDGGRDGGKQFCGDEFFKDYVGYKTEKFTLKLREDEPASYRGVRQMFEDMEISVK